MVRVESRQYSIRWSLFSGARGNRWSDGTQLRLFQCNLGDPCLWSGGIHDGAADQLLRCQIWCRYRLANAWCRIWLCRLNDHFTHLRSIHFYLFCFRGCHHGARLKALSGLVDRLVLHHQRAGHYSVGIARYHAYFKTPGLDPRVMDRFACLSLYRHCNKRPA